MLLAVVGGVVGCLLGWALAQAALYAVGETVRQSVFVHRPVGNRYNAARTGSSIGSAVGVALAAAPASGHHSRFGSARWRTPRQAIWRPSFHVAQVCVDSTGGFCALSFRRL